MALGKLDIIIAADTATIRKDMSTAVGIMQSSTAKMESVAKNAGTLVAGYLAFDLFKTQITQTLEFADSLSKLTQKTGISANELYSLSAAAKLSDVNFEGMAKGLGKFSKSIGENSKTFDTLGLTIKNNDGTLKNSFDLLGELSDKFADMPDGASKATLAMQLFGKSGSDMIPLLNGGKEALREYLGVMDGETGKAAERFNDSITRMGLATKSGMIKVLQEALPFVNEMSTELENFAKKGSLVGNNAEYLASSFDIFSSTLHGSKDVLSSLGDTFGATTSLAIGMADSVVDIGEKLGIIEETSKEAEKTLTFFQFLAVDIQTASLAVTYVSDAVKLAINDFMNLGFEAEKSFLKMKSFVGGGSKEDDYRIAQLSMFVANRNMDSANLALKETEIAQSIMDYQSRSSAQNWARENNVLNSFREIGKIEFKGASDTQKIIETYEALDKAKDEAIKKAGGDVDKIATINAKYQATAQKLNNSFTQNSAPIEDDLKKYNAALTAQIQGLEKQFSIKTQIENLNIESSLRREAITKPEADFLKEKSDILSQIAKNQEVINLLNTKKYDSNNQNDEVADLQKVNDLKKEQELQNKKLISSNEKYNITTKEANNQLQISIDAINSSDMDKAYQSLSKEVQTLISGGASLAKVGEYATKIADQIEKTNTYSHLQTEFNIRKQIADVSLYGTQKENELENIRHDETMANIIREFETKKINIDEYAKLLEIELKRNEQNSDAFYKFMVEAFDNINKALDSNFFDAMTGKFHSFGDWLKSFFKNIGNSIAQGLSRTLAGSITNSLQSSLMGAMQGNYAKGLSVLGGGASLVGTTVSASELAGIMSSGGKFDEATNTITTSGGTVLKVGENGSGTVSSTGSDILGLANTVGTLKTAYSLLTTGISNSIMGGFNSIAGMTGIGGISEFGVGIANPFAYSGMSGLPSAMTAGSMLSSGLLGGGIGYGVGSLGDMLFGAYTKAGLGGALGGATGGILASLGVVGGPLGIIGGSLLGSILGGMFGTKKTTDTGYQFMDTASADNVNALGYQDWKKKSWFSSSKGTNFTELTEAQKKQITKMFEAYDYLLVQLGDNDKVFLDAGKYTGATFADQITKNFITAFTDVNQNLDSTIYNSWVEYATSVNKTVQEALATSVATFIQSKRTYEIWSLGDGVEALAKKAQFAKDDLDNLANALGATDLTVENYLAKYNEAIKNSFTPETITNWKSLGEALMSATDASKVYTDAVKAQADAEAQKAAQLKAQVEAEKLAYAQLLEAQRQSKAALVKSINDILTVSETPSQKFEDVFSAKAPSNLSEFKRFGESLIELGSATDAQIEAFRSLGDTLREEEETIKSNVAYLVLQGDGVSAAKELFKITDEFGSDYAKSVLSPTIRKEDALARAIVETLTNTSKNALNIQNAFDSFKNGVDMLASTTTKTMNFYNDTGVLTTDLTNARNSSKMYQYDLNREKDRLGEETFNLMLPLVGNSIEKAMRSRYNFAGEGIAGIVSAMNDLKLSTMSTIGRSGKTIFGDDVIAYDQTMSKLENALNSGAIGIEKYTSTLDLINTKYADLKDIANDVVAQQDRIIRSFKMVSQSAVNSLNYYFGQIEKSADAYWEAAKTTDDAVGIITQVGGRLKSLQDVLNYSASNINTYFNADALKTKQQGGFIADYAKTLAESLTTQTAQEVSNTLLTLPSFSNLSVDEIKKLSLVLGEVGAFDTASMEFAFNQINSELIKGNISQDQYKEIFGYALDVYKDTENIQSEQLSVLKDIRDYQESLLLSSDSPISTLSKYNYTSLESQSLASQAKSALEKGDITSFNLLFSDYKDMANQFLSISKDISANKDTYMNDFVKVYSATDELQRLSINGSHATGLDYVPFDGYVAELHKGERVETASEVKKDTIITELKNELRELKEIFLKNTAETTRMSKAIQRVIPDGDAISVRTAV